MSKYQSPLTVQVRTYNDERAYERDARKRENAGWNERNVIGLHEPGHVRVSDTIWKAILTGGLYFLFAGVSRTKTKNKIIVTWERDKYWDVDHY